jgi:hypothetical protein
MLVLLLFFLVRLFPAEQNHDPLAQVFSDNKVTVYPTPSKKTQQELARLKKYASIQVDYESWLQDFCGTRYNIKGIAIDAVIKKVHDTPLLVADDKYALITYLQSSSNQQPEPQRRSCWRTILNYFF